jgi:hypothetical protein
VQIHLHGLWLGWGSWWTCHSLAVLTGMAWRIWGARADAVSQGTNVRPACHPQVAGREEGLLAHPLGAGDAGAGVAGRGRRRLPSLFRDALPLCEGPREARLREVSSLAWGHPARNAVGGRLSEGPTALGSGRADMDTCSANAQPCGRKPQFPHVVPDLWHLWGSVRSRVYSRCLMTVSTV